MHSYISICSPHLGCCENSNMLIDAGIFYFSFWDRLNDIINIDKGIWIMQKIHKS